MEPIGWPKTLVNNYQSTLHGTPEEQNLIYDVVEA
jgi:hypothetical protein